MSLCTGSKFCCYVVDSIGSVLLSWYLIFYITITLVNKDFAKCLILADSYKFFGAESEYDLRICPNGFIFFVTATHNF
jgi:hypothetical protein